MAPTALRCFLLCLSAALAMGLAPVAAHAKGAPVAYKKVFRELIIQGERPEIAACMVAATKHALSDAKFDAIRWADNVSDTAHMREVEGGIHVTRTVRLKADLRERGPGSVIDAWDPAEIVCEQRDEQLPEVRFGAASP